MIFDHPLSVIRLCSFEWFCFSLCAYAVIIDDDMEHFQCIRQQEENAARKKRKKSIFALVRQSNNCHFRHYVKNYTRKRMNALAKRQRKTNKNCFLIIIGTDDQNWNWSPSMWLAAKTYNEKKKNNCSEKWEWIGCVERKNNKIYSLGHAKKLLRTKIRNDRNEKFIDGTASLEESNVILLLTMFVPLSPPQPLAHSLHSQIFWKKEEK